MRPLLTLLVLCCLAGAAEPLVAPTPAQLTGTWALDLDATIASAPNAAELAAAKPMLAMMIGDMQLTLDATRWQVASKMVAMDADYAATSEQSDPGALRVKLVAVRSMQMQGKQQAVPADMVEQLPNSTLRFDADGRLHLKQDNQPMELVLVRQAAEKPAEPANKPAEPAP